jgi:hypothetical protein
MGSFYGLYFLVKTSCISRVPTLTVYIVSLLVTRVHGTFHYLPQVQWLRPIWQPVGTPPIAIAWEGLVLTVASFALLFKTVAQNN